MQNTYQQQSRTKLIAVCIAIIVIAGIVLIADQLKASQTNTLTTTNAPATANDYSATSPESMATPRASGSNASANYKDGTYSASSEYYVPTGYESIKVTLTLNGGIVTNSFIQNSEGDHDSAHFQEDFAATYKSYVVGKKLSDIHLSYVAGASDTAGGFNDALAQIESQAQA